MIKNILFFILLLSIIVSCKQKDFTPSWIKIDSFTLTTNEVTQGPNSHAITDAWIYIDGNNLGVFELPCKIPVLEKGEHNLVIFPGIKNNGISSTRIRYPFYKSYDITVNLVLNDTIEIAPVTAYKNVVSIPYLENFESAGISIEKDPNSDTTMSFVNVADFPEIVKYGNKCGGIFLTGNDSVFIGNTTNELDLPKGETVYLELDYRNNNTFTTGVTALYFDDTKSQHTPLVLMTPQSEGQEVWRKIYIELTEDIAFETNAKNFQIYFLAGIDKGIDLSKIYVDNIKVVHI